MKPGLILETFGGDRVEDVCAEAQRIADKLDRSVGFTFNDVRCVALPGGKADKLTEMQQEAQRSHLVVYSNAAVIEIEARGQ